MTEDQKKRESMEIKEMFLHKSTSESPCLGMEFTGELMPKGPLTSYTACNAYRYFVG